MVSNALLFGLFVFASLGGFVDVRTTEVGLANGYTEVGLKAFGHSLPNLSAWVLKEIGIQGAYILKAAALPIGFTFLTALVSPYFMIPQIALGASSFGIGIKDYLALRAKKIAVF